MSTISFSVFVCHTSDLDPWVEKLYRYSKGVRAQFRCELYTDDHEITAGEAWNTRVRQAIFRAHGAVLLVGDRFMKSAPIQKEEWLCINERRGRGFPVVCIPIKGYEKDKLQDLLGVPHLDDLIAVPSWNDPLLPVPEMQDDPDHTIATVYTAIARAVTTKAATLQRRLRDSYSLRSCLGIGPISSTFVADDHQLARKVVIKCLNKIEHAKSFTESVEQMSKMSAHPSIVRTYSANLDRDPYYCVKEFVDGQSLRTMLDDKPAEGLPVAIVQKILVSMCSAISHFHRSDRPGLNIKPSNIIIGPNDETSFCPSSGDEAVFVSKDGPQCLGRDMVYLPPEEFSRLEGPDKARGDQYHLGVLGYEMLLGRDRFASQDAYHARLPSADDQLAAGNARVRWRPIETLLPECPRFLSVTINQMVEIDPGKRFNSMDEVCERISRRDSMVEIAGESYKRIMRGGRQKQIEFFGNLYGRFLTECTDAEIHFRRFQPLKIPTDAAGGMREISVDGEWHEQFTKLKQAVLLLLAYASLKENEEPTILTEYAVSHKERGIPGTLYEPFQECLIDAAVLADEWWRGSKDELRAAWKEATKHGIQYMMEGAGPDT